MREYFANIQQCVDALAPISKIVPSDDHIMHIFVGLGSKYESMISVIIVRMDSITVQEVISLFLTQENRIKILILLLMVVYHLLTLLFGKLKKFDP